MDTPRAAARCTDRARTEAAQVMATARRRAMGLARRGVHLARREPRLRRLEVRVRGRLLRPAVTIVLPVYNVEPYIGECLDSIAAQTFRDYEVVVVDDGSQDGSVAIVEQHAARDHRIRVVRRENGGLG